MAAVDAYEEGAPDVTQQLPGWILEWQRCQLPGSILWAPTARPDGWSKYIFEGIGIEIDPSPFQAYEVRPKDMHSLQEDARAREAFLIDREHLETSAKALYRLVYPARHAEVSYSLVTDDFTDSSGWIYASKPKRIAVARPGGRASQRWGDKYRARWWRLKTGTTARGIAGPEAAMGDEVTAKALNSFARAVKEAFGKSVIGAGARVGAMLDPVATYRRSEKDAAQYAQLCERTKPWTDAAALADACVAAFYMRAAYGYAARAGMIDTVSAGTMAFTTQKVKFDVADHVDVASCSSAFVDMVGLRPADVVCARWHAAGPFHPAYVVARDHDMRWIVVTIRGTLSWKDILTDMAARCVPFMEGLTHEGILAMTENLVAALRFTLEKELAARPGYKLVFCGHSMGGAAAALAVAMLRAEAPWAADCVAMGVGTPGMLSRSIGDRLADERAVLTVVNGTDWSPCASLTNVNELLSDLTRLCAFQTAIRAASGSRGRGDGDLAASRDDDPNEQLPPGRILQLAPHSDDPGSAPALLEASPADYRHRMPVWPDVAAHLPIEYIRMLLAGLSGAMADGRGDAPDDDGCEALKALGPARAALRRMSLSSSPMRRAMSADGAEVHPDPDGARELLRAWLVQYTNTK